MNDRSIQLFKEALKHGEVRVYNIRVMVVGDLGVGKTTMIKRLLGKKVNITDRQSTEGIIVHVHCCRVLRDTWKWTSNEGDSEQDFLLQRLAKVLNEKQPTRGKVADKESIIIYPQKKNTPDSDADYDKDIKPLDSHSPQQNFPQKSSTTSQQDQYLSTVDQRNLTQSDTNPMAKSDLERESHKKDPIRETLQLLQKNVDKLKPDVGRYAPLTVLDFAGQYVFYTTHQMFLTRRAIYLLVSDVSGQVSDLVEDEFYFDSEGMKKCRVHELVEVWLNSIYSCAPSDKENMNSTYFQTPPVVPPTVILVGTHVDQIPQRRLVVGSTKAVNQNQTRKVVSSRESKPVHPRDFTSQESKSFQQRKTKPVEQVSSASNKKGDHKAPEVLMSDENKQPVSEKTSTQTEQEMEHSDDESSAGSMPPQSTSDADRFMRIAYLLVDVGSQVLRHLMHHHTITPTSTLDQYLANNRNTINSLLKKKVLNISQMVILFPPNGGNTNLDEYDITLLSALFNNIVPQLSHQEKSMIQALREERNKVYGHAKSCKMNAHEYQTYYNSISSTLITLSQQCGDPNFENEILLEIQRTQVSAVPAGSYLDILKAWFSRIETVEESLETFGSALQVLTSRVDALESQKSDDEGEGSEIKKIKYSSIQS